MKFQKKNVLKSTIATMAIAVAAFGYLQSNEANPLSNVKSTIGAFTKVSPANASGDCSSGGSGCTIYVDGKPYTSKDVKEPSN